MKEDGQGDGQTVHPPAEDQCAGISIANVRSLRDSLLHLDRPSYPLALSRKAPTHTETQEKHLEKGQIPKLGIKAIEDVEDTLKKIEDQELHREVATNLEKPGVPAKILKEKCSNVEEMCSELSEQEFKSEAVSWESNKKSQSTKRQYNLTQIQEDELLSSNNTDPKESFCCILESRGEKSGYTGAQLADPLPSLAKKRKEIVGKQNVKDDANAFEFIKMTLEKIEHLDASRETCNKPDELLSSANKSTTNYSGHSQPSTSKSKYLPLVLPPDMFRPYGENSENQQLDTQISIRNQPIQENLGCEPVENMSACNIGVERSECAQPGPIGNEVPGAINLGPQTYVAACEPSPACPSASFNWWEEGSYPKPTNSRQRWSSEAKLLVYGTFRNYIEQRKGPGLKKCRQLIDASPLLLEGRSPAQVNSLINNWIHGKSPKPVDIGVESDADISEDGDDEGEKHSEKNKFQVAKRAVLEEFSDYIDQHETPGLDRCQALVDRHPRLLAGWTATRIYSLVSDWILGKSPMPHGRRFTSEYFPKERWSLEAKRLVIEEFSDCIKQRAAPGEKRCRELIERNPTEFVGRRPVQVNLLVDNWLKGKAKPPVEFEHLFANKM